MFTKQMITHTPSKNLEKCPGKKRRRVAAGCVLSHDLKFFNKKKNFQPKLEYGIRNAKKYEKQLLFGKKLLEIPVSM